MEREQLVDGVQLLAQARRPRLDRGFDLPPHAGCAQHEPGQRAGDDEQRHRDDERNQHAATDAEHDTANGLADAVVVGRDVDQTGLPQQAFEAVVGTALEHTRRCAASRRRTAGRTAARARRRSSSPAFEPGAPEAPASVRAPGTVTRYGNTRGARRGVGRTSIRAKPAKPAAVPAIAIIHSGLIRRSRTRAAHPAAGRGARARPARQC